ncbi:hypothetical protein [Marinitoga lauensis]|uniref:hypothetical protein n=1 Tax=Marinitoga lauensis TaxID=2201189 RepID=UPI001F0F9A4C|nr:hypothetical protein [Marinitoga lauensis]
MKINKMFLKSIIDIVEYGSFSKPIVNYIENNINDISLKYYISLLKSKWKRDYYSAIDYANKTISTTTTTTILRELARFELVSLYTKIGKFNYAKKKLIF